VSETPTDPTVDSSDESTAHEPSGDQTLRTVTLTDYDQAGELLRALSSPLRLAIVDLLADRPGCVHELVEALGVSQPLVSQHLKTLRAANLVATQRRGREMVYRLADDHVAHVVRDAVSHAGEGPGQLH
jgi:DNA-binding transcriptional ArsR family regulator